MQTTDDVNGKDKPTTSSAERKVQTTSNNASTEGGGTQSPAAVILRPSNFKLGKEIGVGSFSTVYVAKQILTGIVYAMKVVDKAHVCRCKVVDAVMMEREVLIRTNHPFIIRLNYTFQDHSRLYYVLEYAQQGELLTHLNRLTSLNVECTRFYAAEILSALNYLHSCSIIHRDLKPENVLLNERMHVKLADFGSAIILNRPSIKAPSFTGTPQYVSPEMLTLTRSGEASEEESTSTESDSPTDPDARLEREAEREKRRQHRRTAAEANKNRHTRIPSGELAYLMDYWALGCVIYQMLSGRPPFRGDRNGHEYEVFQKVLNLRYEFLDGFDPCAKELVQSLLVIKPTERFGSPLRGGPTALHSHTFFQGINWSNLSTSQPPLLVPNLEPLPHADWDKVPPGFAAGMKYQLACEIAMEASQVTESDRASLLREQERTNPFHRFVRGRLIVKQGILYKRRGLFARKRVFLLTEGPHLFYVDQEAMVLKGEVPWSTFLRLEMRNSKIFCIHVPTRTYYLEDPTGNTKEWIDKLAQVKALYFAESTQSGAANSSAGTGLPTTVGASGAPSATSSIVSASASDSASQNRSSLSTATHS